MKVKCVFSLESPRWGDSNEYTQYTIFQYKEENHPKLSQICNYGICSKGPKNEFETVVVNESSVFEPLKFYCNTNSTSNTQNQKGKKHTQVDDLSRLTHTVHRMNSSSPNRLSFSYTYPDWIQKQHLFLLLNKRKLIRKQDGHCYPADHIVYDHIHTDIINCNIEKHITKCFEPLQNLRAKV